ncbi:MAG: hypothetical protein HXS46_18080 [Theionarchaea archaeon]|nr:MAG: hypothetical protein AYK18_13410 [Theionarchaea archaeon DG-70]MBU7012594.1 hypothetical protein [Theionarchaea archaeon]
MPIHKETIINKWFNNEKNLSILNGIVRHWTDRQIARDTGLRIDKVANYRSKLKKKGLLTTGFFTINHEKLGLVKLMDFPRERPSLDDVFLIFLMRISRPFGYLRQRLLPPEMVEEGYQLGPSAGIVNDFSIPFVQEDFGTQFEEIFGQDEPELYEKKNKKKNGKIDLLSIYICKEVERGNYGARVLAKVISQQIDEEELGIQPSISNTNRRLQQLKKDGVICMTNPLNLLPLRPYYSMDTAIVKKNENFLKTLTAFAKLNVMIRFSDIMNEPDKAYVTLQYHFSQKWDILGILKKYLERITFFDHAPFGIRRTIPYEYFKEILTEKKYI